MKTTLIKQSVIAVMCCCFMATPLFAKDAGTMQRIIPGGGTYTPKVKAPATDSLSVVNEDYTGLKDCKTVPTTNCQDLNGKPSTANVCENVCYASRSGYPVFPAPPAAPPAVINPDPANPPRPAICPPNYHSLGTKDMGPEYGNYQAAQTKQIWRDTCTAKIFSSVIDVCYGVMKVYSDSASLKTDYNALIAQGFTCPAGGTMSFKVYAPSSGFDGLSSSVPNTVVISGSLIAVQLASSNGAFVERYNQPGAWILVNNAVKGAVCTYTPVMGSSTNDYYCYNYTGSPVAGGIGAYGGLSALCTKPAGISYTGRSVPASIICSRNREEWQ